MATSTFPFHVAAAKSAANPARQFLILARLVEREDYGKVFEDFGYGDTGPAWREHLETILEEFEPELLDHLEFEEDDQNFLAYADSPAAVRGFMACVLPYFGDLGKLRSYLMQTDPSDFFE